ncbi:MAG: glycoside hydrolase family 99-like domain-containing protein [Verrucomicrobia bacterium]|nr:glycoside hydrolase family 99-like domain-containing protein [Verrucomicrobiota bacterium]
MPRSPVRARFRMHQSKPKLIAYYLPQYHAIPENDEWWGKGFTEWTNVAKAQPLFRGHRQPRFPADLGYYDLRVPEVREQQAELARRYGISGFCYYHYWFGDGRRLLERPFNEVVGSGRPDFPFCLCWANETWRGIWFGSTTPNVLVEQTYPGKKDYEMHFEFLRPAFEDDRYIRIDDKPVFQVLLPHAIPDLGLFTDTFRRRAEKCGLKGLYLLTSRGPLDWDPRSHDFDGVVGSEFSHLRYVSAIYYSRNNFVNRMKWRIQNRLGLKPDFDLQNRNAPIVLEYREAIRHFIGKTPMGFDYFPCVVPNWDNTARAGRKALILVNSTPELWKQHLQDGMEAVRHLPPERRMVMIKSWNEWAEGNYLEPDSEHGHRYLEVIQQALAES